MVAPTSVSLCELIRTAPDSGIKRGRTDDAVIAVCVIAAGANALLTFNEKDFRSLDLAGDIATVPGS